MVEFSDCDDAEICISEFDADGQEWLELLIGAHIGKYRIKQAWQLSRDGRIAARVWSRGVSCSTDHEHHPYFRLDFDIAPSATNQVWTRNGDAGGDWVKYTKETAGRKDPRQRLDVYAADTDGLVWQRKWDGWKWSAWTKDRK